MMASLVAELAGLTTSTITPAPRGLSASFDDLRKVIQTMQHVPSLSLFHGLRATVGRFLLHRR